MQIQVCTAASPMSATRRLTPLTLSLSLSLRRLRQTAGGWRAGRLRHDHQREKRGARGEASSLAVRLRGSDPPPPFSNPPPSHSGVNPALGLWFPTRLLGMGRVGGGGRSWLHNTFKRKLVDFAWNRRFFYLPGACLSFFG